MKLYNVDRTCTACPAQWDAMTEDDHSVYIRYRSGQFLVAVCTNRMGYVDYGECSESNIWKTVYEEFRDSFGGYMDDDEMLAIVDKIEKW